MTTAPLRVGFLSLTTGINRRGVETWVENVASRLASRGHEATIYQGGPADGGGPVRRVVIPSHFPAGVEYRRRNPNFWLEPLSLDINSLRIRRFSLRALPRLLEDAPDFLFVMNSAWALPVMKRLRRRSGTQLAIVGHAGVGPDDRRNLRGGPDLYVATTKPVQDWADGLRRPQTRTVTIPSGTDLEAFRNAEPEDPFGDGRPYLLCPAALVPYKRVDRAIEAASRIDGASLVILGHGPLKEELRALGERLLPGRFRLLSVPNERIHGYYKGARAVTLASQPVENAPLIYAEAMAAGKPVVTTDFDRARWILGEAGVYVDPNDTDDYAGALRSLFENEARYRSLCDEASARAREFGWEAVVDAIEREIAARVRPFDTPCPSCGDGAYGTALACATFSVLRCRTCSLGRTWPCPATPYLEGQRTLDRAHWEKTHAEAKRLWHHFSAEILGALAAHKRGGRLLDIGCGSGHLLSLARERGWRAEGIEASPEAAAFARETLGLDASAGTLDTADLPASAYDAVTMIHVLEHLPDPVPALARIRTLLAPRGILLLNVPNFDSLAARAGRCSWYGLQGNEHAWQFSPASLARLAARAGFGIRETFTRTMYRPWDRSARSFAARAALRAARAVGAGDNLFLIATPR